MISTMTPIPTSPSHDIHNSPYPDDLHSSLIESFQVICSHEQIELCQKLGLLNKSEQHQAIRMAKAVIDHQQLPVHANDWHNLIDWVHTLRDRYKHQLDQQSIRTLSDDTERIQYFDQIASLSARLEVYGQAHDDLTDLLAALKGLRNDWKHRRRDVENIVLSILSASNEYRVIKVTRSHLTALGLGFSSIGKYYIVFESHVSDETRKALLNHVAHDFSQVFQENAAQNLARMAGSYHRVFDQPEEGDVIADIQQFVRQVYHHRPRSVILNYPTSLPIDSEAGSSFLERRKSVVLVDEQETILFNMAQPQFEPAGWDWPQILKHKKPRNIWSTSVSRLADHFAQVGLDYYSNMLNNARLMHAHRTQMFEFATHSLLKVYRALQLEQGLANLNRTLCILYKLQQHTHHLSQPKI
ncbi:hypothetical protein CU097_007229 [Rhizopus azygosporus]|uniref:Uncharacterized protein n=1 Tax=Rhizopus azygosporus TaxID=86630 RepID=A0A367J7E1_RHIAZ|nr:hypothetical protein CU097_007229 [Rhizopus azygosporus]